MAANAAITIGRVLITAAAFAINKTNAKTKAVPAVPDALKNDKDRWLQCTLRNATDFPILATSSHFDSGRYDSSPARVDEFDTDTFTCCEGDNTFMTGVSGGQAYHTVRSPSTGAALARAVAVLTQTERRLNSHAQLKHHADNSRSNFVRSVGI